MNAIATMTENEQVQEILTSNGLDFEIIKKRMLVEYKDEPMNTPYFALINAKSGNVINAVKDGYSVTQNEDIVKMVVRGMQGFGDLSIQKAGSINDGRKVFIQLAIDGLSRVGNDDIKRYITIIDSNDGSTGLSVGIGDLTMSCQNQFFKFYKAGVMKFRHTASITDKVRQLPRLINQALSDSMQMIELYKNFQSTSISRELAHKMVNHIFGHDRCEDLSDVSTRTVNAMDSLYAHLDKEISQKGLNLWGLHSGVTSWTTHDKSAPRRENGRLESMMVGTNYDTNQQSLSFAEQILSIS